MCSLRNSAVSAQAREQDRCTATLQLSLQRKRTLTWLELNVFLSPRLSQRQSKSVYVKYAVSSGCRILSEAFRLFVCYYSQNNNNNVRVPGVAYYLHFSDSTTSSRKACGRSIKPRVIGLVFEAGRYTSKSKEVRRHTLRMQLSEYLSNY